MSTVESASISAIVEEALEKLSFLAPITPDILAHRNELSPIVGDEITRIIGFRANIAENLAKVQRERSNLQNLGLTHGSAIVELPVAGLAWDLETTGFDEPGKPCEIVQIAIVIANSNHRALCFCSLVLPEGPIDAGATAVHGLTREVLLERGARPLAAVWAECEAWLDETLGNYRPLIWAAHNGDRFDRPILSRSVLKATGRSELPSVLSAPRASFVDTLVMARRAGAGRRDAVKGYTA